MSSDQAPDKPVAWQRMNMVFGWQAVHPDDLDHYRKLGVTIRPLYAAPPDTAALVAQARREALEEAAKLVQSIGRPVQAAAAIRALIDREDSTT